MVFKKILFHKMIENKKKKNNSIPQDQNCTNKLYKQKRISMDFYHIILTSNFREKKLKITKSSSKPCIYIKQSDSFYRSLWDKIHKLYVGNIM